jgi:hypothetical protein
MQDRECYSSLRGRPAFTVVDLMTCASLAVVLLGIGLPALQESREAAHRTLCKNNLKQIGSALHSYHDTHRYFPAGITSPGANSAEVAKLNSQKQNVNLTGWVLLLPWLEHSQLYVAWDLKSASSSSAGNLLLPVNNQGTAANLKLANTVIPGLMCPSDNGPKFYQYLGTDPRYVVGDMADLRAASANYLFAAGAATEGSPSYWSFMHAKALEKLPTGTTFPDGTVVTLNSELPNGEVRASLGIFGVNSSSRIDDLTDGTSNLIAVGESVRWKSSDEYMPLWGAGKLAGVFGRVDPHAIPDHISNCIYRINQRSLKCDSKLNDRPYAWTWSSAHCGGAQFVLADGSVRFINENIDSNTFSKLNLLPERVITDAGSF